MRLLAALLALVGATVAQSAVGIGPDKLSAAAVDSARVIEREMTVADMKSWTNSRSELSDWLPGIERYVGYLFAQDDRRYQVGDRVQVTCMPLLGGQSSMPCDSVRVSAELGLGQLPIGIEWALLSPADLADPVSMERELLDSRFARCGGDGRGEHFIRIRVDHCDTTRRADTGSQEFRSAVNDLMTGYGGGGADVQVFRAALERNKGSVLLRVFYAAALRGSGRCEEYCDQRMEFYKRGYVSDRPVREHELERCRER